MTLEEQIALGVSMGLRHVGFWCSGDVYAAIEREFKPAETDRPTFGVLGMFASPGSFRLAISMHLPHGSISPMWETDPGKLAAFPMPLQAPRKENEGT